MRRTGLAASALRSRCDARQASERDSRSSERSRTLVASSACSPARAAAAALAGGSHTRRYAAAGRHSLQCATRRSSQSSRNEKKESDSSPHQARLHLTGSSQLAVVAEEVSLQEHYPRHPQCCYGTHPQPIVVVPFFLVRGCWWRRRCPSKLCWVGQTTQTRTGAGRRQAEEKSRCPWEKMRE